MPRGVYVRTKIHCENISKALKGFKCSEQARQNMRKPHRKFKLSQEYIEKFRKGKNNHRWKGGQCKRPDGYIIISNPTHPFCDCKGYVRRSHLCMEKKIGRYLIKGEIVHHVNGIKDDDRPENLKLFANDNEHRKFHNKLRNK